jgi:hypothetical protein
MLATLAPGGEPVPAPPLPVETIILKKDVFLYFFKNPILKLFLKINSWKNEVQQQKLQELYNIILHKLA